MTPTPWTKRSSTSISSISSAAPSRSSSLVFLFYASKRKISSILCYFVSKFENFKFGFEIKIFRCHFDLLQPYLHWRSQGRARGLEGPLGEDSGLKKVSKTSKPLSNLRYFFNFKFWSYKVPHLKDIGFDSNMTYETFKITPPDNCQYYAGHTEALVPILYKPKA